MPDFRILYPLYVDVLVRTDDEIKQIIFSDDQAKSGEEIFYSFGNASFNYKLKADISNFDSLLMANAMIDLVYSHGYDALSKEHMQIFTLCCGKDGAEETLNQTASSESWFKFFSKFKDFLLVSICDEELVNEALVILHNFLTSASLKFQVYEECKDSLLSSIKMLYSGDIGDPK